MSTFLDYATSIVNGDDSTNVLGFIVRNNNSDISTMLCADATQYREVSLGDVTGTCIVYEDATETAYLGTTSTPNSSSSQIQASSATADKASLQLNIYSADATSPKVIGYKSRSGVVTEDSPVNVGDSLIEVAGIAIADSSVQYEAGSIRCEVQSVPSAQNYVSAGWTVYNTAKGGDTSRSVFQVDSEGILRTRSTAAEVGNDYPSSGVVSLSGAGTATISHGSLPSDARILLTVQPGQAPTGVIWVSAVTANTSFVITSTTGATDNGVSVFYQIFATLS